MGAIILSLHTFSAPWPLDGNVPEAILILRSYLWRRDIMTASLQMAIQNCIDMAAHIVREEGLGIAGRFD